MAEPTPYVLVDADVEADNKHHRCGAVTATIAALGTVALALTLLTAGPLSTTASQDLLRSVDRAAPPLKPPNGEISLNYVRKESAPAFQGMAIGLQIPGATLEAQQCLVDLGSSTAAFCDASLAPKLEGRRTSQAQCNMYGDKAGAPGAPKPGADCPVGANASHFYEFFMGSVYRGDLVAETADSDLPPPVSLPAWRLADVEYTVMSSSSQMTCALGFDGIFGVAFDLLNTALELPADAEPSSLLHTCSSSWGAAFPLGACNASGGAKAVDRSPILRALAAEGEKTFGLYADLAAIPRQGGQLLPGRGALYLGAAATRNPHYLGGTPQTVRTWERLHGAAERYWSFQTEAYELRSGGGGGAAAAAAARRVPFRCASYGTCIVDSGNPGVALPHALHAEVAAMAAAAPARLAGLELTLHLVAGVALSIPGSFLAEQLDAGYLEAAEGFTLGLPFCELYYLVFDDEKDEITFVDLPRR